MKKRVLIFHPRLLATGGASALAAWVLEALKDQFDVSVFIREGVDFEGLNRFHGTSLKPGDFRIYRFHSPWSRVLAMLPVQGELLHVALVIREFRLLDRRERFDIAMSTSNEFDFGRRGIQYIHYPWAVWPRPANERRWYHAKWTVGLYKFLFSLLSGASFRRIGDNATVANSGYIAALVEKAHGRLPQVLYPPVPGGFPETPWLERRNAMVGIGRLSPEKRWPLAVDIVRLVRESGIDMRLTLIGTSDDAGTEAELRGLADRYDEWFTIHMALPHLELVRVVAQHRYAIHAMENEHFGIAPAELQRAGCILFVHRSGGPMEITGNDERQMFSTAEDCAAKIVHVVHSPELQSELRTAGAERSARFTTEAFVAGIRKLVHEFQA